MASTSSTSTSTTSTSASTTTTSSSTGGPLPLPDGGIQNPCQLPGSVIYLQSGATTTIPGGNPTWPDLSFLKLPAGFCAHYYGTVGNARQMRFAPGGELFVASPTASSTGGGPGGMAADVILPDDNLNGVANSVITFLSFPPPAGQVGAAMNQGILFAPGYFYYQDGTPPGTKIMRLPYATGDRKPSGTAVQVADINVYTSGLHWPKTLDRADDGSIYVGNGGDQGELCKEPHPFHGGILKIDSDPGGMFPNGQEIAQGFRNPINVRCAKGHDKCFALELALDYSAGEKGREKLVPIRKGDDWGYPCCATANTPYTGVTNMNGATPNCSGVAADNNSFVIGDTPFGVDFEPGYWPAPFTGNAFVVTHGAAGSWVGARVVAIPMDPSTGLPTPSTNTGGTDKGMVDFATGWTSANFPAGRPAAVAFSSDGRLFVANDNSGVIFWIAPAM